MRISKELSRQISFALTEKTRKKVDELLKAYQKLAAEIYLEQIPKRVSNTFSIHFEYFRVTRTVRWEGHGFSRTSVTVEKPLIADCNGDCKIILTPEISNKLKDAENAHSKIKVFYERLRQELENTLQALGTYKQITEKFPLAEKYLPVAGVKTMALIPNLDKLTDKIKNQ